MEFEYNDRSYAQSTVFSNQKIKTEKVLFNFNFYSESDWKNQNYLTELSDDDKQILSESGDNETQIFSNSIDSVAYNNEVILYKKMDTTISGISIIYYKFSNNYESAHYQIKFTQVDQNNGDYILKEEGINGRIFSWIPPVLINGELVSPKNLHLYLILFLICSILFSLYFLLQNKYPRFLNFEIDIPKSYFHPLVKIIDSLAKFDFQ